MVDLVTVAVAVVVDVAVSLATVSEVVESAGGVSVVVDEPGDVVVAAAVVDTICSSYHSVCRYLLSVVDQLRSCSNTRCCCCSRYYDT